MKRAAATVRKRGLAGPADSPRYLTLEAQIELESDERAV